MLLGEVFEQTIPVDGERATVTLLDMWDSQVTLCLSAIYINRLLYYKWWEVLRHSTFCVRQDEGSWTQERCLQTGDAFIIVYAITDRSSFLHASELRIQLRREREADRTPIILVGNKCDLVRCREVSISGKYIVQLLNAALLLILNKVTSVALKPAYLIFLIWIPSWDW